MYLIIHAIVETLITGRMIPSGTNSLPAEVSVELVCYIKNSMHDYLK
jgi:hypothetical protein